MASYPKRRGAEAPPPKKTPSVAWFGLLALAVLGGGAVVASLSKKDKAAENAQASDKSAANKPFADMPPEKPPAKSGGGLDSSQPFGSLDAGNLGSPAAAATWSAAVALAEEAEVHYQAAVAAKTAGDVPALNEAGALAKQKFNQAVESTAVLEDELRARLGDSDPTVRAFMGARSTWFKRLDWLLKSTGR